MNEDEKSFVSRWSRLKRTRAEEGLPDPAVAAEQPVAKAGQEPEDAGEPDVEELIKSLPDIETMTEESDFTVFMQQGVPQELKQRALRRLWRLNPIFANLDGLNDYDEDFNATALIVKNVKTLYEVGKGMPRPEKPEEEEAETASETDQDASPEVEEEGSAEAEQEDAGEEAEPAEPEALAEDEQGSEPESSRPRTLAADAQPRRAEPAPIASPHRGRAAERRWGPKEG